MQKIQNQLSKCGNFLCVAILICSSLLIGCSHPDSTFSDDTGSSTGNSDITDSIMLTEDTKGIESTREFDDSAIAALVGLRQALVDTPQHFAVAYFGYAGQEGNIPDVPYAVINEAAPQLCEDLPFLQQISEQKILGTVGNLFCIVPADENATVSVNFRPWDETTKAYGEGTVLYRCEKGDPFLLMTSNTAWCLETEVVITNSDGEVTVWYPFIGEDNRIAPFNDDSGVSLYFDFSAYDD